MSKKNKKDKLDIETLTAELIKLSPEDGDVFILNIDTDDNELLYSDDMYDSISKLSEVIFEITGVDTPVLLFGKDINLSLLTKDELNLILTDEIVDIFTKIKNDEFDDDGLTFDDEDDDDDNDDNDDINLYKDTINIYS